MRWNEIYCASFYLRRFTDKITCNSTCASVNCKWFFSLVASFYFSNEKRLCSISSCFCLSIILLLDNTFYLRGAFLVSLPEELNRSGLVVHPFRYTILLSLWRVTPLRGAIPVEEYCFYPCGGLVLRLILGLLFLSYYLLGALPPDPRFTPAGGLCSSCSCSPR